MLLALALCAFVTEPAVAGATSIDVTTGADVSGEDDLCSLREAINAAQTNTAIQPGGAGDDCPAGDQNQDDTIQLAATTYSISGAGNENSNATGDFDIGFGTGNEGFLTIDGVADADGIPQAIIDAADQDRIFDIQSGGTPTVAIHDVTLRNGKPPEVSSDGGAILIRDDDSQFELTGARIENSEANGWGGGLANLAGTDGVDINITQTEFSGNSSGDDGGGLYVDVPQDFGVEIKRSAFVGNHSDTMGGGIYISSPGTDGSGPVVELENGTVSGNTANAGGGGVAFDFGLTGTFWSRFSTIAQNSTTTPGAGGGIYTNDSDQFVLFQGGTIISGNTSAGAPLNCSGPGQFSTLGNNLDSGATCFPTPAGTDLLNTDPLLAPLAYNAGGSRTTRTHGLFDTSPALNRIPTLSCGNASGVDQRGVSRPVGAACDVGAFEGSVGPVPPTGGGGSPPGPAPSTSSKKKKCKKKKRQKAAAARTAAGSTAEVAKKKKCKKKKRK
jgi:CSLREA domain-containing protein